MDKVNLSIVLPCYNPLPDWADTILSSMQEIQQRLPYLVIQLIVVNDGSSKNIDVESVKKLENGIDDFLYINYEKNRGKGHALRQGIEQVSYDLCIYTDIDFPYTTDSFVAIFEKLYNESLDVVVGIKDAEYYKHVPTIRKWISKILRFFIKLLLRIKITDTQCGIKGFNQKGRKVFLETKIDRYLFDLEFVFSSSHTPSFGIESLPVALKPGVVFSKVNFKILFTESRSFLKLVFRSFFRKKNKPS
ncbi:MAG: glycosyltransferase family 2 protein [Aureispira sp.]|nr:glycosyltransferase family 2 protein [Aureispira sp.]